jgi:hypothetical protein
MSTRQRIGRRAAEGIKANPWEWPIYSEEDRTLDLQFRAELKSMQKHRWKLTTMARSHTHTSTGRAIPASGRRIARSRIRLTLNVS